MDLPILYPIIDTALCRERAIDPVALAEACLAGRRAPAAAARQEGRAERGR